jgi:hypothetical protein
MKNNDVNRVIGSMWKELTKEEIKTFEEYAFHDKLRYLRELAQYNKGKSGSAVIVPSINPPPGYDINGEKLIISDVNPQTVLQLSPMKVKRAKTAYSIFAHRETLFVSEDLSHCTDKKRKLGKHLGARWVHMSQDEKELYILLEESNQFHMASYVAI